MKKIIYAGLLVMATAFPACVHESAGEVDPTLVSVDMLVTLEADLLPSTGGNANGSRAAALDRRFVIEARREGKVAARQVIVVPDTAANGKIQLPVSLQLHAVEYTLAAWADRVTPGDTADLYYNTADLQLVTCTSPYTGNTPDRDCLRGAASIDLREHRDEWNIRVDAPIALSRPLAAFELVATDAREFLDKTRDRRAAGETYTVTVTYGFYFPLGCNALTGNPERSEMSVTYTAPLQVTDDGAGECVIVTDYIFAGTEASYLPVSVEIRDSNGKGISRSTGLNVSYERGHLTTVRDHFLTNRFDTGIGIDPDFDDDDIEVEI